MHRHEPIPRTTCALHRANVRAVCAVCGDVIVYHSGFRWSDTAGWQTYRRWSVDEKQHMRDRYWTAMRTTGRA